MFFKAHVLAQTHTHTHTHTHAHTVNSGESAHTLSPCLCLFPSLPLSLSLPLLSASVCSLSYPLPLCLSASLSLPLFFFITLCLFPRFVRVIIRLFSISVAMSQSLCLSTRVIVSLLVSVFCLTHLLSLSLPVSFFRTPPISVSPSFFRSVPTPSLPSSCLLVCFSLLPPPSLFSRGTACFVWGVMLSH